MCSTAKTRIGSIFCKTMSMCSAIRESKQVSSAVTPARFKLNQLNDNEKNVVQKQSPLLSMVFDDCMTFLNQIFVFSRTEVVSMKPTAHPDTRAVTNRRIDLR